MQQNQRQINTIGIAYMVSSKYQKLDHWIAAVKQDFMKRWYLGGRIERNHEGLESCFR